MVPPYVPNVATTRGTSNRPVSQGKKIYDVHMCRVWGWSWVLVAVAACGAFPRPQQEFGIAGDAGVDDDAVGFEDAAVGFDADPPDAFVPLDGAVIDGAPQGTPPSTG